MMPHEGRYLADVSARWGAKYTADIPNIAEKHSVGAEYPTQPSGETCVDLAINMDAWCSTVWRHDNSDRGEGERTRGPTG